MTSRKVSHYFNEHPKTVVSSAPLSYILNNPDATGRVAKWNIELSPRDLNFKHPAAIKAKYSTNSSSSGWRSRLLALPTSPTRGRCSSMDQRGSKEPELVSY